MLKQRYDTLKHQVEDFLEDPKSVTQRRLQWCYRLIRRLAEDMVSGPITLHAMSLVYTTLLSIVPLLALCFSLLRAFDVHMKIEPMLLKALEPFGAKGVEIAGQIIDFVENVKVGALSTVGLVLLLYSAISLIQKVEVAFNSIWQLRNNRSLMRRLSDYLSVFVVGPLLVFTALGLSGTLLNHDFVQKMIAIEPFGFAYRFAAQLLPYLFVIAAFTFLYLFIPNTKVRIKPALIGGIVSGVLWQTTSWLFAMFVVTSASYTAVYSSFAILFVFMVWVYVNWLIILIGADLVFYLQYPENLRFGRSEIRLSIRDSERIALLVLFITGRYFYTKKQPVPYERLVAETGLPGRIVANTIGLLKQGNLLTELERGESWVYQPALPLEDTSLREALEIVRNTAGLKRSVHGADLRKLDSLLQDVEKDLDRHLSEVSLKDLLVLKD
ncbi:MAG TPA: YihY/virulence factor BrkB family protein [Gammaproteobacteria bacterium]|nr:YihY/virulence factor BrkB family protein [Gammaproteobacteria bacterium]